VDDVIREPEGGTHNDPAAAMQFVNERLERHLGDLKRMSIEDMLAARYAKFRNIAQFYTQD
jgi:acetyl-CoA carboxylase carboxyl transferase subunit alpha